MFKKKICMLGAFSVGKTSLVRQFVTSMFSDSYLTTVGVKVVRKEVKVEGNDVSLLVWDISGEDSVQEVRMSYLRGSSGFLFVADGTRRDTLDTMIDLQRRVSASVDDIPFRCLLNKSDLQSEWQIEDSDIAALRERGWRVFKTSAKTGEGVSAAFLELAQDCVSRQYPGDS